MIDFSADPQVTEALQQWRGRAPFPTEFGSADLRMFSKELRMRSVFSARMTNAEAVQALTQVVDDMLSGKINLATGRWEMMKELKRLGYDPAVGFPQDMADVPPAEAGSLKDLSSERRLDLMLETNQRIAANYGRVQAGNTEYARHAYPAWELVRIFNRTIERGTPASKSAGWDLRWHDAGESVGWQGALFSPWMARKDSPIWQALGDGEGGYRDTLGNPFPPFAFQSGMGFRAVPRSEAVRRKLIASSTVQQPAEVHLAPSLNSAQKAMAKFSPDIQEALRAEIDALANL